MRWTVVLLALAVLAGALPAQDWIRLESGKTVRGEILAETESAWTIVDLSGERHEIPKAEVKRAQRKSFKAAVAERLAAVKPGDAAGLLEVARFAAEDPKLAKDAPRVALRVVAVDPENAEARGLLGHVRALGRWFQDRDAAREAVSEEMTARGYVWARDGWVKQEALAALEANPAAWMLVEDFEWRLVDEVMRERGFRPWEGEWYPREEHDLVERLETLKKRTGQSAQAARAGSVEVYHVLGRETAREHAENVLKARAWFVSFFEVDPERTPLLARPTSRIYVLEDVAALADFAAKYRAELGMSEGDVAFAMRAGHLTWRNLGHATSLGHALWKHLLVSQMGGDLTQQIWHHGFEIPAWLWVAAAHNAEHEVFGEVRVQYMAPDQYGRKTEAPELRGLGLRDLKARMGALYEERRAPDLKLLFHRHFNELTAEMQVMGYVLLHYLREQRGEGLRAFVSGPETGDLKDRFVRSFGAGWSEVQGEFEAWCRKP